MEQDKKLISILITHYNRPLDLLKCLNAIKEINLNNYEIVVSDDGSEKENINLLKEYKIDKLLLSETNQGLAANINKGIKACNGEYILYCQEDFILSPELKSILPECFELLKTQKADMIRLRSNCEFKNLKRISKNVYLIPKFSIKNFLVNPFRYSDHPFITKNNFFSKFGFYLESTSGDYGETEYATRMFKSSAKIALVHNKYVSVVANSKSVIDRRLNSKTSKFKSKSKYLYKILRAFRLHFEWIFYNKSKRGLITYVNRRNK